MLLRGSSVIASGILNVVNDAFTSTNILQGIVKLIPFNFDFLGLIVTFTKGFLLLSLAIGVLKSLFSPITGDKAESPLQVAFNTIVAALLILLFFGTSFLSQHYFVSTGKFSYENYINSGLLSTIGQLFSSFITTVFNLATTATDKVANSALKDFTAFLGTGVTDYIGMLILSAGILGSVISGAIAIVERAIQLAMFILMGPLCLAMYSNQLTRKTASTWITGIISQFIAIGISLMMWGISMNALYTFLTSGADVANSTIIGRGALAIVFFSITGNSEELLNAIGIKTMSPMDSARMVGTGFSDMLRASNIAGNVGRNIASAPGDLKKMGKAITSKASSAHTLKNVGWNHGRMKDNNKAIDTMNSIADNSPKFFGAQGKGAGQYEPTLGGMTKAMFDSRAKALTDATRTQKPTVAYNHDQNGLPTNAVNGPEMCKTQELLNPERNDTGSSACNNRLANIEKSNISKHIPGVACDVGFTDPKTGQDTHVSGVFCGYEYPDSDGGWHIKPCLKVPDGYDASQATSIDGNQIGGYISNDLSSIGAKDNSFKGSLGIFTDAGAAQMAFSGVSTQLMDGEKDNVRIATDNRYGTKGDFILSQPTLSALVREHPAPEPKETLVESTQVQEPSSKTSKRKIK